MTMNDTGSTIPACPASPGPLSLVVAPRGRGKTTLLVRVMAELRSNDSLSARLLPIRLMEESQEIFNLADFWLECLYYLAKSCAESDSGLADELAARHAALAEDWADKTLEGRARAAVLDAPRAPNDRAALTGRGEFSRRRSFRCGMS